MDFPSLPTQYDKIHVNSKRILPINIAASKVVMLRFAGWQAISVGWGRPVSTSMLCGACYKKNTSLVYYRPTSGQIQHRAAICPGVPPSAPLDNIRVMVIVWRLRGNIIRTAPCWVVWHNVHSQQHTEQFL